MRLIVGFLLTLACAAAVPCPGVEVVRRSGWGARAPRGRTRMTTPVARYVIIHHTTGGGCTSKASCSAKARAHQNDHMNRQKWSDIGYSFLIGGDGRVYEGRGWGITGAHTRNYNNNGIAISFIGNFQSSTPNAKMQAAAKKLIQCGVSKGHISKSYSLHGHRDANCTACPGNVLYNIIKKWSRFKGRLPKFVC